MIYQYIKERPATQNPATGATLDTDGWLTLTQQGFTPGKMHQASLGALTYSADAAFSASLK